MGTLTWPLLLLVLGLGFLMAEAFIPSGGMLPLLALVSVGLSLWEAFRQSYELGLGFLLADTVLLPLSVGLGLYLWQKSPLAARMTLKAPGPEEISVSHSGYRVDHLIGERGFTLTPLKPTGLVDFDGRRLEGVSEQGLIPEGTSVEAVSVRSGRLMVRMVATTHPATT